MSYIVAAFLLCLDLLIIKIEIRDYRKVIQMIGQGPCTRLASHRGYAQRCHRWVRWDGIESIHVSY
ncbi:MAG: hypothetical protein C4332_05825 [Meiothermus sp.]